MFRVISMSSYAGRGMERNLQRTAEIRHHAKRVILGSKLLKNNVEALFVDYVPCYSCVLTVIKFLNARMQP